MRSLIYQVHEGMTVYDQDHNEIGTVDQVQFGDENPHQPGAETATVHPAQRDTPDSFIDHLVDVFRADDIPEEMRSHLVRHGFIRIDAPGLFNADRYVVADQIASVADDEVVLNVSKTELIRRP